MLVWVITLIARLCYPDLNCQLGWNCATDEQGFVMASRIIDVTRFDVKHVLPQDELLW
jgi:hypothetical protein